MSRSPYAIRKGFEYQDLVCCHSILSKVELGDLDCEYEIESDSALHVDDLVLYENAESVVGKQVKFHVNQEYAESFETLTKRRTPKSTSLIEKLYKGWISLQATGRAKVRIEFVTTNPAERGRYKLGPAIETATGRINEKFFSHNDYQKPLEHFKTLLDVEEDELRKFLGAVEWRLSYESIVSLRRLVSDSLRRLQLPSDSDAVSRLVELMGVLANADKGRMSLGSFIQEVWSNSRFRDACEQRFSTIDFGSSQQRRANSVGIAVVSLEAIPSIMSTRYACLEEPIPFADFRFGVTATDQEGLLDSNRTAWRLDYEKWLKQRVESILAMIPSDEVDLVVFPRFSLPVSVAASVAEWGRANNVSCVVGGHSLPQSEKDRVLYQTSLNISPGQLVDPEEDLVVDSILRFNRAGRISASILDTPFARTENVVRPTETVALETADGWINVVLLPSKPIAQGFFDSKPARPELGILATGIHSSDLLNELSRSESAAGMPAVLASSDTTSPGIVLIYDPNGPPPSHHDAWEGVRTFAVTYDRSHSGWSASVKSGREIPLVYHLGEDELNSENCSALRGTSSSRTIAIESIQRGDTKTFIQCETESSAEFFFRRGSEAEIAIRAQLQNASPDQMVRMSASLSAIAKAIERYRVDALLPQQFTASPQKMIPTRISEFLNRSKEKADIGRFLSSVQDQKALLIHGQPGIGKKELLSEVQRLQANRQNWVRFRCMPNSRLFETLTQLMVRLGVGNEIPTQVDQQLFKRIAQAIEGCGAEVVVLEDAEFLPIFREHQDHNDFLELLSYFCSNAQSFTKAKLVLVSNFRGNLQFSNSHRMESLQLKGLEDEYVVELIQEHLLTVPSRFEQPTVDELWTLASKLHGHPFMARLAAVVLEDSTVAEVTEKLYTRIETRNFVLGRLLAGITLSDKEKGLLEFASVLRIPVSSEAFSAFGGPTSHALLEKLLDRFLMICEDNSYKLHPVMVEFFRAGIEDSESAKRIHSSAYNYFSNLTSRRKATVEERAEYLYHAVSSNKPVDMADMQMFAGSIRSALDDAVRNRDWDSVENAAKQLLSVWPYDVYGHIAMALALESSGRQQDTGQHAASLEEVTRESLWLGVEYVKSLIRQRNYDGAERNLAVIQQRFSDDPRVVLATAQLHERKGETDDAVGACESVLSRPDVKESDAFLAALMLRDTNRLDLVVKYLERRYEESGFRNDGLLRLYSLACVISDHDPQGGLQVLGDLWNAAPDDGFVVSDYGMALVAVGRTSDAKSVLDRGVHDVPRRSRGYRSVLEACALLLERQERFTEAFQRYRDAIVGSPNHLHLYRNFARCLLTAAGSYRKKTMSAQEDSVVIEAKKILTKLLHIAPSDEWAANMLHKAEHRTY